MALPVNELQLSREDYLSLEEKSDLRHEYVGGRIFAMTGASEAHNVISTNLTVAIGSRTKGSGCRLFANDMKVLVESSKSFYYPDLMVSCEAFFAKCVYKTAPCLIVEILSPSTADIDRREKLLAYQTIDSLNEYVIAYQDQRRIELYRREADQWKLDIYKGTDTLSLFHSTSFQISLGLDEIYEGVLPI